MASPMEIVIQKMRDLGFFQFILPFILTSAIFYGALRKSKMFGDPDKNVIVNGVIASVAAFMVWAYPIIVGVNIETQLASFFAYGMIATIVVILGLIISGLFMKEDLPTFLEGKLGVKGRGWMIILIASILVGVAVAVTSGLVSVIIPGFSLGGGGGVGINWGDWIGVIAVLGLMLGSVAVIVYISSGGEKKE
jgi:hypothetical protein